MEWPEFFAKLAREETHEELLLRERKQVQKVILKAKEEGYGSVELKNICSETADALIDGGCAVKKSLYKVGPFNAVAYSVTFPSSFINKTH